MNSGDLNANQELCLLYFIHFAKQSPLHSIQKKKKTLRVRKKIELITNKEQLC